MHYHEHYKWLPLLAVAILLISLFYFQIPQHLSWEKLVTYESLIQQWVEQNIIATTLIYLVIYTLLIACGIPCGTLFTLVGGFLFGLLALPYSLFCTTFGGMLLYLAVRTSLGRYVASKSAGWLKQIEHGFQKNAFRYLLMLRLVPVFPCSVSNISAGMLNVPLKTFLCATVLGITPATFIYVMAGCSLDQLRSMQDLNLFTLFLTPSIVLPLLALAMLCLFPVIYKRTKKIDCTKEG